MKHPVTSLAPAPSRPRQKAAQDTAAGCREFASADLARASLMESVNGRRRFETSAASWTTRAEMIQRLDDSFDARQAIARAEWADGEATNARHGSDAGDPS